MHLAARLNWADLFESTLGDNQQMATTRTCLIQAGALSLLGAILCFVSPGCSEKPDPYIPTTPEVSPYSAFTPDAAIPEKLMVRRDYRLNPGDQLEIIYHVKAEADPNQPYRLQIEDVIDIRFPFNPELDQRQTVHSDGHITLLLIGRVKAIALTSEALAKILVDRYSRYLKDPAVSVTFEESNVKIKELKKAITTAPRGQSRLVPIKPDGKISLPFIVDIMAAGKTIDELHKDLNAAYLKAGIEEIEVTVNVQTVAPQQVYVYGEVYHPGRFPLDQQSTLIQALGAAGGIQPTGARKKVILVRRKNLPIPEGVVLDFEAIMEAERKVGDENITDFSMLRYDITLEDGDLIYVPRTDLAKNNDWIDQVFNRGLRGIVPYDLSFYYEVKKVNPYGGF